MDDRFIRRCYENHAQPSPTTRYIYTIDNFSEMINSDATQRMASVWVSKPALVSQIALQKKQPFLFTTGTASRSFALEDALEVPLRC